MVDTSKSNYYTQAIFECSDGTKYAINPFANSSERVSVPKLPVPEPYSSYCGHCDLSFDDLIEYEHHNVEMHGQKKVVACNLCNATFRRQDHLKRHIQSLHINQKYCNCPVCGKDCKRQDILLKHIKRKHNGNQEVFHCRECKFQCGTLSKLDSHEKTHLLTERHVCPHCQTTFKRRDHMLRHVKSQHLNQFVVCPICGQVYKRKDHVVRHVREKHKMGLLNGKLIKSSDIL
ncbi:zinc finger protein 70-like [Achroia grisella]|uniref:zinc finger protein 70-like n=1 Tax=Achroia grisella TaxID=688607 RepID=UPI0027D2753F|nr:zinc finger protein 70-like [Achroia grisella]